MASPVLKSGFAAQLQYARAYQGTKRPSGVDAEGVTISPADNFSYQLPADTFSDADGDALTYAAALEDGSPLPNWLSFDSATRTLSGTPTVNDFGFYNVVISASDGASEAVTKVPVNIDTDFMHAIHEFGDRTLLGREGPQHPIYGGSSAAYNSPREITFSFMEEYYNSSRPEESATFKPMTDSMRDAVRDLLKQYESVANLVFTEVADVNNNDSGRSNILRYGTWSGSGSGKFIGSSSRGDIFLNYDYVADHGGRLQPGARPYGTLLHETGHALGLHHSGENGGSDKPPTLEDYGLLDLRTDSVMSYTYRDDEDIPLDSLYGSDGRIFPENPMRYDVATLQYIYGANNTYNTGNNVYKFDPSVPMFKNIWDAGGIDTIDASSYVSDVVIDLTPGSVSSLRTKSAPIDSSDYWGDRNLSISYKVFIENAVGGSGHDRFVTNAVDNFINGGDGMDKAVLAGLRDAYKIYRGDDGESIVLVSEEDGRDVFLGVEMFEFSDGPTVSYADLVADAVDAPLVIGAGASALMLGYRFTRDSDDASRYLLDITAESLFSDYDLESFDVEFNFNSASFADIAAADVRIASGMSVANAVSIDNVNGVIRIAGASVSDLTNKAMQDANLATIALRFDSGADLSGLTLGADGRVAISNQDLLGFNLSPNKNETVFSRSVVVENEVVNRDIATLEELGGSYVVGEERIDLQQQGGGVILGTQRLIGADAGFTNLLRKGDTVAATSTWLNAGSVTANNVAVSGVANAAAQFLSAEVSKTSLGGGSYVDGMFKADGAESASITAQIWVTGNAGTVLNAADGLYSVSADGAGSFSSAGLGTKNLITFQGDLNYDGRVSMKDLAYLNAGAARQKIDEATDKATAATYARDVDADFSGKIDLADLAVLDADWGKTLHTGDQTFTGSGDLSWEQLDLQGSAGASTTWDNQSFKAQNAVEADASYVGSLESPSAVGVIGADGDTDPTDADITGTTFQDIV